MDGFWIFAIGYFAGGVVVSMIIFYNRYNIMYSLLAPLIGRKFAREMVNNLVMAKQLKDEKKWFGWLEQKIKETGK